MSGQEQEHHHHKEDLVRIGAVAIALLLSWLGIWKYLESFENIRERRMTMELSMSIAVMATLLIQQYFTGLVITFFVLIAEYLEHLLVSQGRNVIEKLLALLPRKAIV